MIFLTRTTPLLLVHDRINLFFKFVDSAFLSLVFLHKEAYLFLPVEALLLEQLHAFLRSFQFSLQTAHADGSRRVDDRFGNVWARQI